MEPSKWLSRTRIARGVLLIVIIGLLVPSAVSAITFKPTDLQAGTVESPANGTTVIAVQGFKIAGQQSGKKPARLVAVGPRGDVKWVRNSSERVSWFYDVDPLTNGNLLVTGAGSGQTTVFELNPRSQEIVWSEEFDIEDTHDVDLINGNELLIANMRNYNETSGENDDRVFIYNRTQDQIVWEWYFDKRYNRSGGGKYTDDWTHVNDIDKIGPGRYLASPRNFDQVIVINRSTKAIEMQLGEDDNYSVLSEQHNPQYLESEDGKPTMLVADSENDRVVEYERNGNGWNRTWTLGSGDNFNWPRDADRLPNGNTLVVDTLNHRVIEVTPSGEIVWEFYAPWGPYDAERITYGDEAGGPTISDQNASGSYNVTGSAGLRPGTGDRVTFRQWVQNAFAGTPVSDQADWFAARWAHITPWIRPVWMGPWDFVAAIGATLLTVGWLLGETVYHRRRITTRLKRIAGNRPLN